MTDTATGSSRSRSTVTTVDWRLELQRLHTMSFAWALYCCRRRREEAQDVLQDVYLRVLDGRAQFAGRSSTKTWLFALIRRTAGDRNRRQWWRAAQLERWFQREPANGPALTPEGELGTTEAGRRLRTALARLSPRQQDVLHLVFYQDLTIEEASELLGISLGSARTHFERGKTRLREQLRGSPVR
jgi:RNA polymerase sigma-70 factor (ECF subfamily)